jgi:hypothetical protein
VKGGQDRRNGERALILPDEIHCFVTILPNYRKKFGTAERDTDGTAGKAWLFEIMKGKSIPRWILTCEMQAMF